MYGRRAKAFECPMRGTLRVKDRCQTPNALSRRSPEGGDELLYRLRPGVFLFFHALENIVPTGKEDDEGQEGFESLGEKRDLYLRGEAIDDAEEHVGHQQDDQRGGGELNAEHKHLTEELFDARIGRRLHAPIQKRAGQKSVEGDQVKGFGHRIDVDEGNVAAPAHVDGEVDEENAEQAVLNLQDGVGEHEARSPSLVIDQRARHHEHVGGKGHHRAHEIPQEKLFEDVPEKEHRELHFLRRGGDLGSHEQEEADGNADLHRCGEGLRSKKGVEVHKGDDAAEGEKEKGHQHPTHLDEIPIARKVLEIARWLHSVSQVLASHNAGEVVKDFRAVLHDLGPEPAPEQDQRQRRGDELHGEGQVLLLNLRRRLKNCDPQTEKQADQNRRRRENQDEEQSLISEIDDLGLKHSARCSYL